MKLVTILILVAWANAQSEYPQWITGTFPDDFEWGFATGELQKINYLSFSVMLYIIFIASYQIEGGWNADGNYYLKKNDIQS